MTIKFETALKIIRDATKPLACEEVKLRQALGRILSKDIFAAQNLPPFDNSAMDGFALNSQDTKAASKKQPVTFKIVEDLPAGKIAQKKIRVNEAARIMTGAAMPYGAESVVKKEDIKKVSSVRCQVSSKKEEYIYVFKEVERGENIRRAGEDVKKSEKVLVKGAKIGPAEVGMLAALGIEKVKVYKKTRVGILSTGDELISLGKRLTAGKIRNSNSYSLYSAVLSCGAMPFDFGIACDTKKEIKHKIQEASKSGLDILLISGGVSVGEYDYIGDVLKDLGAKIKFWRLKIRPGKPLLFAILNDVLIFGLPGNPVSSLICFEEFVKLAIIRLSGNKHFTTPVVYAILDEKIEKKKGLTYFLRVKLENKKGRFFARLSGSQGSGILKSLVLADGLMVLPEGVRRVKKDDLVKVQLL